MMWRGASTRNSCRYKAGHSSTQGDLATGRSSHHARLSSHVTGTRIVFVLPHGDGDFMVRSFPRTFYWLALALAVAWLSMIAAPRRVIGQDYPRSNRSYYSPSRSAPTSSSYSAAYSEVAQSPTEYTAEPAPPSYSQAPPQAASGVIGTSQAPHYWIVSSRCDVQHKRHMHLDDGVLDVYERTGDGQLHYSNMGSLQAGLIPGVPVLVCVHGNWVAWEDECFESHLAYQWFRNSCPNLPLQVVFFTWPSNGHITGILPTDVAIRGKQAEFNGFHVARMMNCIPESCPVTFMGHSFGCRVILSTLHLAGGGAIQGMQFPGAMTSHRYRAVFAAAAVDHHWMNPGDRYGCALPRTECVVNLRNRKDFALALYPLHRPFAGRALARSGLTRRDTRLLGAESQKVVNIDVTDIEGHNHLWPGYFNSPEIGAAIANVIYWPEVNQPMSTPTYTAPTSASASASPVQRQTRRVAPRPAAPPVEEETPAPVENPIENPVYVPMEDSDTVPAPPLLAPSLQ